MSWPERFALVSAWTKRQTPEWVKDAYHRRAGLMTQLRFARATVLEPCDWSRTRAFSLAWDEHGFGRINLKGRERLGIVEPRDYQALCDELEGLAQDLVAYDGRRLVQGVARPAFRDLDPRHLMLPDLIVRWNDVAMEGSLRTNDPEIQSREVAIRTGSHSPDGFCVAAGRAADLLDDPIPIAALHRVLVGALND
jgi:predicted AlkP superfamily phosphohydrolase/phosphomutase